MNIFFETLYKLADRLIENKCEIENSAGDKFIATSRQDKLLVLRKADGSIIKPILYHDTGYNNFSFFEKYRINDSFFIEEYTVAKADMIERNKKTPKVPLLNPHKPKQNQKRNNKLSNSELKAKGHTYNFDIGGYYKYLYDRGYSFKSDNGAATTCDGYTNAIIAICAQERYDFNELCYNIDRLVVNYGLEGVKKELGEKQKGTWRNALNRLQEFVQYINL